jgi:prepilin-type N-terminal cleavage/methylation domain-containing protein
MGTPVGMHSRFNRPQNASRLPRGFTLIESMIALFLVTAGAVVAIELLTTTSHNMDVEIKESDLNKRTTGRLYEMIKDIQSIMPTADSVAGGGQFQICSQGGLASVTPPAPPTPPPGLPTCPPPVSFSGEGQPVISPTTPVFVGDCISFRIPAGLGPTGIQWAPHPISGAPNAVFRYRWAPLVRGGVTVPGRGMLVKEILDTNTNNWDQFVLEEDLPACDGIWNPSATPTKYPSGFAVFQGDVENGVITNRTGVITICIQRASDLDKDAVFQLQGPNGTTMIATAIQTIFLKNQ